LFGAEDGQEIFTKVAILNVLTRFIQWLKSFFVCCKPLNSSGRTDVGMVRPNNEDNFVILAKHNLFFVADGMGGHNAGEVASRVAIETMEDFFSKSMLRSMQGNTEQIRHAMITAMHKANDEVIRRSESSDLLHGMGSTLVAAMVDNCTLHICHVGDVRCYRVSGENLEQLTTDHTAIAKMKANGGNNSDVEPDKTISRHVVTRAIGFPFDEDPEYNQCKLEEGNKLLLCSDGLWSMVDDSQILTILEEADSPDDAVNILINEANKAGGKDNVTAVVVFC